ncbi:hypothetical protein E1267_22455 [Nonomuraea longispora]|uniref:DUF4386 family protein n=2 Tax=Nonomuraea TaxID=83681 RepID=A0A4R4N739_9ACTN|nr:hypothetical protein [Nonomuraea longispora]TDC04585.1 hypothetical protein E1267_22455 [Nonomuraea longispora]
MNPANRLAQASFTAGPAALLGGWLLMRPIDGDLVPGPWWTAAHAVWLAGFVMFGVMTAALRGVAGPVTGGWRVAVDAAVGAAMIGVAANVVQLAIDLYAGFTAVDGAAMRALFERVKGYPGVETLVYSAGATLFFAALVALALILAALRRVTFVGAGVTVVGVAVMAVATFQTGRDAALVAVGMALIWLGVLLLGRGPDAGPSLGSSAGIGTNSAGIAGPQAP